MSSRNHARECGRVCLVHDGNIEMTLKTDGVDIVYADHMNNLDPLTLASVVYPTGFTSTRIQNAVNLVPSSGGTIFLRTGTYSFGTVVTLKSGIRLIGAGRIATILQSSGAGTILNASTK